MASLPISSTVPRESPSTQSGLVITLVTETYPPEINGVATTLGALVDGLRRRGHAVQIIRPRQGAHDAAGGVNDCQLFLVPSLPIPGYAELRLGLPAIRSLLGLWRKRRPDVVHVATEGPLGWSAVSAARRLGIPVTSSFHTNFHVYSRYYGLGWLARPIMAYLRHFHNRTWLTLVPTSALCQQLGKLGLRNLAVLGRGVDSSLFSPEQRCETLRASWGAGPDDLVLVYVGRLAAEKNLDCVFAAYAAVRAHNRSARLVLVGDGPLRTRLERDHPEVHFAGRRVGGDLARHYASADVCLFPSLTETYGNVTLEALSSGLPVVAFDYAAAHELIVPGENGLLAPFGSCSDFCAAAQRLTDLHVARAMGQAARRTAIRQDWTHIFDRFEQLLGEALSGSQRGTHAASLSSSRAAWRL